VVRRATPSHRHPRQCARAKGPREKRFWLERRSKHLLTGLARCGDCGAPLAAAGKDYLSCSAARRLGTCKNREGIRRAVLEELILDALKHNLNSDLPGDDCDADDAHDQRCHDIAYALAPKVAVITVSRGHEPSATMA
jgi:hypothetical protein